MKYDLTQCPVSDDDQPLKDETGKVANYRTLLMRVCAADVDGDMQPVKGTDKMLRYDVYIQLKRANGSIELDPESVAMLTKGALAFPTIVAGQVRDYLSNPGG